MRAPKARNKITTLPFDASVFDMRAALPTPQDVAEREGLRLFALPAALNVMLAAGGYPWTVVPVEQRAAYFAALEDASVRQNIVPFAGLVAGLVSDGLQGRTVAAIPATQP